MRRAGRGDCRVDPPEEAGGWTRGARSGHRFDARGALPRTDPPAPRGGAFFGQCHNLQSRRIPRSRAFAPGELLAVHARAVVRSCRHSGRADSSARRHGAALRGFRPLPCLRGGHYRRRRDRPANSRHRPDRSHRFQRTWFGSRLADASGHARHGDAAGCGAGFPRRGQCAAPRHHHGGGHHSRGPPSRASRLG